MAYSLRDILSLLLSVSLPYSSLFPYFFYFSLDSSIYSPFALVLSDLYFLPIAPPCSTSIGFKIDHLYQFSKDEYNYIYNLRILCIYLLCSKTQEIWVQFMAVFASSATESQPAISVVALKLMQKDDFINYFVTGARLTTIMLSTTFIIGMLLCD